MASRIARIASLPIVLMVGTSAAWAGRGDIDPNYGEGGAVSIFNNVLLALPGDRLVIAGQGFGVRMVDAAGQNVPDFGEGGVIIINSSDATRNFSPEAAALAPNGDMIFAGQTSTRALLRLDKDGKPVPSFGNSGDGIVETALTPDRPFALAVDPEGKILLAQTSLAPDNNCNGNTRLQRLLADGQPDAGFGSDGIVEIPNLDVCSGIAFFGTRADGSVIVGDGSAIVAVDAAGDIDPAFGVDGRLAVTGLSSASRVLLPDGGLLFFGSSTETGSSDTVAQKFDQNGQPDLTFGAGTGSVTVDLGGALLGDPSVREYVGQPALDPDGEHFVVGLSFSHDDGSGCTGIGRLSMDGVPDTSFGRNGLTCLNALASLIAVQSDGAPLFLAGFWGYSILRLLPDNRPSPGFLTAIVTGLEVDESAGTVTVTLERVAGRDGAVSANFATVDRTVSYHCGYQRCSTGLANAGFDYTSTSGRLDWASGEEGQRSVTISILEDGLDEKTETFAVEFSEPGGGVLLIAESPTVYLGDNDATPPSPPPPPPPPPPASGGGGSVSWATPLALLALLFMRRRRDARAKTN